MNTSSLRFPGSPNPRANLVFASDYNHIDSKFSHTVETVTQREEIFEHVMAEIMGENAGRLYSL